MRFKIDKQSGKKVEIRCAGLLLKKVQRRHTFPVSPSLVTVEGTTGKARSWVCGGDLPLRHGAWGNLVLWAMEVAGL